MTKIMKVKRNDDKMIEKLGFRSESHESRLSRVRGEDKVRIHSELEGLG